MSRTHYVPASWALGMEMRRWFLSSGLTVPARSEVFEYVFQSQAIKVRFALRMRCRVSRDSDKEGSKKLSRRRKLLREM